MITINRAIELLEAARSCSALKGETPVLVRLVNRENLSVEEIIVADDTCLFTAWLTADTYQNGR